VDVSGNISLFGGIRPLELGRREIKKILVLCLPGIGDTLLFTPALRILREHFPQAQIWVLVMFKGSKEILEQNPHIDRVLLWEFLKQGTLRSLKYLLRLRRERFDISIIAYPANRIEYSLVHLLAGARMRCGHRYQHRDWRGLSFLNGHTVREDDRRHNVEENLALVRLLGAEVQLPTVLELFLTADDRIFARDWLVRHQLDDTLLVGFHAGTAEFKNQAKRRWAVEKFAALGDRLTDEVGARILIFGGPDEEELKDDILGRMSESAIIVSSTTMRQTAALIERCALFISNDSALMHTAAAMQVPCVVVFGPTNPKWVCPYGTRHHIVRLDLPCSPCFYYSAKPLSCIRGNFACIKEIEVDQVMAVARRFLPNGPPPGSGELTPGGVS
jgi:heptosyltransferase-2